jgi:hypothetical protein
MCNYDKTRSPTINWGSWVESKDEDGQTIYTKNVMIDEIPFIQKYTLPDPEEIFVFDSYYKYSFAYFSHNAHAYLIGDADLIYKMELQRFHTRKQLEELGFTFEEAKK